MQSLGLNAGPILMLMEAQRTIENLIAGCLGLVLGMLCLVNIRELEAVSYPLGKVH